MKKLFYPLNLSSVLGWILMIQDIYMLFAQDNCYDSYSLMFREFQLDTDRWQPAVHVLVIQLKALQFLMHWNLFSLQIHSGNIVSNANRHPNRANKKIKIKKEKISKTFLISLNVKVWSWARIIVVGKVNFAQHCIFN